MHGIRYLLCCAILTGACTSPPQQNTEDKKPEAVAVPAEPTNPYPSTYRAGAATATLIRGATVLTGTGTRLDGADVLLANGSNPISLVIPCHRLIGADGSLTGYGGGLERKRWLLEHEGVRCVDEH